MKKCFEKMAVAVLLACAFASCKHNASPELKPEGRSGSPDSIESVYVCSVDGDSEDFKVTEEQGTDGSRCVNIEHLTFAATMHYRLYDPDGALRIVAAGPQEQVGMNGYRIDYDEAGRVSNIIYIGSMNDPFDEMEREGSVAVMKRWLAESLEASPQLPDSVCVSRDEEGNIVGMDNIYVPDGYRAKLLIREWGPFWESDLWGGNLQSFVLLEKYKDIKGSHVNWLYLNGKLLAEMAYWDGVFIKARTYNRSGSMVSVYADRNVDLWDQTYYDYTESPMWYVE